MDTILTMRGKGFAGFRPRVLSLRSRPSVWRLLACFLGLFIIILGTFSRLFVFTVIIFFYVNGAVTLVRRFFGLVNIGRRRAITSPLRV
jgi:hypothetical protein